MGSWLNGFIIQANLTSSFCGRFRALLAVQELLAVLNIARDDAGAITLEFSEVDLFLRAALGISKISQHFSIWLPGTILTAVSSCEYSLQAALEISQIYSGGIGIV